MSLIIKDRILETSTTTGTGALTLGGAVAGYRTFSAVCSVNDVMYYLIEAVDSDGIPVGGWETGFGTYSATNTLTRTTVIASSNSNAAVSFGVGTKRVSICAVAQSLTFRGALVYKTADQLGANYTANPTYINFDGESYDTDSIHSTVTNTSRLTVPAGVSKVKLSGGIALNNVTANKYLFLAIDKNGATTAYPGQPVQGAILDALFPCLNVSSPVVAVTSGDYFELRLLVEADTSVDLMATDTWFSMEIIE